MKPEKSCPFHGLSGESVANRFAGAAAGFSPSCWKRSSPAANGWCEVTSRKGRHQCLFHCRSFFFGIFWQIQVMNLLAARPAIARNSAPTSAVLTRIGFATPPVRIWFDADFPRHKRYLHSGRADWYWLRNSSLICPLRVPRYNHLEHHDIVHFCRYSMSDRCFRWDAAGGRLPVTTQ